LKLNVLEEIIGKKNKDRTKFQLIAVPLLYKPQQKTVLPLEAAIAA
jgi:hypothetical protein